MLNLMNGLTLHQTTSWPLLSLNGNLSTIRVRLSGSVIAAEVNSCILMSSQHIHTCRFIIHINRTTLKVSLSSKLLTGKMLESSGFDSPFGKSVCLIYRTP